MENNNGENVLIEQLASEVKAFIECIKDRKDRNDAIKKQVLDFCEDYNYTTLEEKKRVVEKVIEQVEKCKSQSFNENYEGNLEEVILPDDK